MRFCPPPRKTWKQSVGQEDRWSVTGYLHGTLQPVSNGAWLARLSSTGLLQLLGFSAFPSTRNMPPAPSAKQSLSDTSGAGHTSFLQNVYWELGASSFVFPLWWFIPISAHLTLCPTSLLAKLERETLCSVPTSLPGIWIKVGRCWLNKWCYASCALLLKGGNCKSFVLSKVLLVRAMHFPFIRYKHAISCGW